MFRNFGELQHLNGQDLQVVEVEIEILIYTKGNLNSEQDVIVTL